jgi:hypothetical protein
MPPKQSTKSSAKKPASKSSPRTKKKPQATKKPAKKPAKKQPLSEERVVDSDSDPAPLEEQAEPEAVPVVDQEDSEESHNQSSPLRTPLKLKLGTGKRSRVPPQSTQSPQSPSADDAPPPKKPKLNQQGTNDLDVDVNSLGEDMNRAVHTVSSSPEPSSPSTTVVDSSAVNTPSKPRYIDVMASRRPPPTEPQQPKQQPKSQPKPQPKPKKKAESSATKEGVIEDEDECAASHAKLKQYGIRVMSKKLDKADDMAALAAYLGFPSTTALAYFMREDQRIQELAGYKAARMANFTVAKANPEKDPDVVVTRDNVFQMAAQYDYDQAAARVLCNLKTLDYKGDAWTPYVNDKSAPARMTLTQILILIKKYPKIFVDTPDPQSISTRHISFLKVAIEDIFRGWCFLRAWWQCNVEKNQKGSGPKDFSKYPGAKPAVQLRWWEGSMAEMKAGLAKKKGKGLNESRGSYQLLASGGGTSSKLRPNRDLLASHHAQDRQHVRLEFPTDVRAAYNQLRDKYAETGEYLDENAADDIEALKLDPVQSALDRTRDLSNKGPKRPPLSKDEVYDFLLWAANQSEVKHDAFPGPLSADLEEQLQAMASGNDFGVGAAMQEEQREQDDINDQQLKQEFIDMRNNVAKPGENIPAWDDAVRELGFTKEQGAMGNKGLVDPDVEFVPEISQVLGTAFMERMENSPLRGGILALDTGLGKTLTVLWFIYLKWKKIKAQAAKGEKINVRPTLIVVPSSTLTAWVNESTSKFGENIDIRYYYSEKTANTLPPEHRHLCLPKSAEDLRLYLAENHPPDNPDTAKLVVVTTYETFIKRLCRMSPINTDSDNLQEEGFGDDGEWPWGRVGYASRGSYPGPVHAPMCNEY